MFVPLTATRNYLREKGLNALVVPTGDPHASEYPSSHWELRKALCPFTGSAGTLVITETTALLWTDSRYWEQAKRELADSGFFLKEDGAPGVESPEVWIRKNLPYASQIGIDGSTTPLTRFEAIQKELLAQKMTLTDVSDSVYDLWVNRPEISKRPVLSFTNAQKSRKEKLKAVSDALNCIGADAVLLTKLDDIAWLTNLRGADVLYTPVFLGFMLVTHTSATLFIDSKKIGPLTRLALKADGIDCVEYDALESTLSLFSTDLKLLIDAKEVNAHLYTKALSRLNLVKDANPVATLKTRKTPEEIASIRQAMRFEGVALVKLFMWIEKSLAENKALTEYDVAEKLRSLRLEEPTCVDLSFETIAAVGENAALCHYAPTKEMSSPLKLGTMLLLDSGGQYFDGTTDITRTIALGVVPEAMKRDYTAVLRGHIAFSSARFPNGLHAGRLDSFARAPLWENGIDYGHSTGHGVGFFLSVHEAPLSSSPRTPATEATKLVEGVVLSDEPGVYRAGLWGVRIENLVSATRFNETDFLTFEPLSLCPYDRHLIEVERLSSFERQWINDYHAYVFEKLSPGLDSEASEWLKKATAPL